MLTHIAIIFSKWVLIVHLFTLKKRELISTANRRWGTAYSYGSSWGGGGGIKALLGLDLRLDLSLSILSIVCLFILKFRNKTGEIYQSSIFVTAIYSLPGHPNPCTLRARNLSDLGWFKFFK